MDACFLVRAEWPNNVLEKTRDTKKNQAPNATKGRRSRLLIYAHKKTQT